MTTRSSVKQSDWMGVFGFNASSDRFLRLLSRSLLASVLVGLIWLPGLGTYPALAEPAIAAAIPSDMAAQVDDSVAESDRMSALIACLPEQLSQPNLKRAWAEMGNNQLERAFNLNANPKLSQAEIDLARCMNR
jgi:hypothetical protein